MKCKYMQSRLNRYLDGELPPEEARRLERHLGECPQCRHAREELEGLNLLLNELDTCADAPPALARRARRAAEQRRSGGIRWLAPVESVFGTERVRAAVAAVLLFAGLSVGGYMAWYTVQIDGEQTSSAAQTAVETDTEPVSAELAAAPPGSLTRAYLAVSMQEAEGSTSDSTQ